MVRPNTFVSPSADSRRAVISYWQKYVHEELVNRLGGLSLQRKSVVRLNDHPNMTIGVYHGHKTTTQQQIKERTLQSYHVTRLSRHLAMLWQMREISDF